VAWRFSPSWQVFARQVYSTKASLSMDRFAGFEAQSLNVHVDFPLFQRMALPVMAGKTKSRASRSTIPG